MTYGPKCGSFSVAGNEESLKIKFGLCQVIKFDPDLLIKHSFIFSLGVVLTNLGNPIRKAVNSSADRAKIEYSKDGK